MIDPGAIPTTASLQDEKNGVQWYSKREGTDTIHYMVFEGKILQGAWVGPRRVFWALSTMSPDERAAYLTHDTLVGAINTRLALLQKTASRQDDEGVPLERLDAKYKEKARKARRPLIQKVYREIASFLEMYPPEQAARMFKNIIKTQQEWKKQEPDPETRRRLHDTKIRLYREALKDLLRGISCR